MIVDVSGLSPGNASITLMLTGLSFGIRRSLERSSGVLRLSGGLLLGPADACRTDVHHHPERSKFPLPESTEPFDFIAAISIEPWMQTMPSLSGEPAGAQQAYTTIAHRANSLRQR